ncbi:P-type conjugative transfer protein TrbL, partial [Escherichia coli]
MVNQANLQKAPKRNGDRMKFRHLIYPCLSVLLILISTQAQAAPLDSAGLLDDILKRFANVASTWAGTIQNYATWIFWSLAVISMVWTFAMMAMQGEGLSAALAEVVRFFAVLGFFFYLLKNGPAISVDIQDSLRQLAANASGLSKSFSPSGIVDIGFDIVSRVVDQSSIWSPADSTVGLILAGVILCVLALVGVNMLLLLITGWILSYGGIFLLGFGGSRWTSDIAITYFKTVLGIALQLFTMVLIVGIGKSFIDQYYQAMGDDAVQ